MIEDKKGRGWTAWYNEDKGVITVSVYPTRSTPPKNFEFEPKEFQRFWHAGKMALKEV